MPVIVFKPFFNPFFRHQVSFLLWRFLPTLDDTDYGSFQPKLSLRQLFHLHKTPADVRVKLVSAGADSVDFLANLGEAQTAMLQAVKTLLGGESPLGEGIAGIINQMAQSAHAINVRRKPP